MAVAVAVTAHGVAGGSLSFSRLIGLAAVAGSVWAISLFFRGRCEPRAPGIGPIGLRVGGLVLCSCSEIVLQKRAQEIIFVCLGVSSLARAPRWFVYNYLTNESGRTSQAGVRPHRHARRPPNTFLKEEIAIFLDHI